VIQDYLLRNPLKTTAMQFKPIEKKALVDFIYISIEAYTAALLEHKEFSNPDLARQTAKQEALALVPQFSVQKNHAIYALVDSDTTLGHLWYILKKDQSGIPYVFLNYIHIHPEHQRKGLATQSLKQFEQEVQSKHHCKYASLYVFRKNTAAQRLYRNHGFYIVEQGSYNEAKEVSRYKMVKRFI